MILLHALLFGGAFVDAFIQNVAADFGLKCQKISRERFGYLCTTSNGMVLIQKIPKPQLENILFAHQVKLFLLEKDFGTIDANFTSIHTNEPYTQAGGDIFTATVAHCAKNADFSDYETFLSVIGRLATFHNLLKNIQFDHSPKKTDKLDSPDTTITYIQGQKRKIMKSGKFSDFDMLFLSAYEEFEKHILQTGFFSYKNGHNNYICHNLLKEENTYIADQPTFVNFARASYGHFSDDLMYIIKRHLKVDPTSTLPLAAILEAYNKNHDISNYCTETFAQLLQFPDKFVKLSKDYYIKKRSFAPKAYITRMQDCIQRGTIIQNWLKL